MPERKITIELHGFPADQAENMQSILAGALERKKARGVICEITIVPIPDDSQKFDPYIDVTATSLDNLKFVRRVLWGHNFHPQR